MLTDEDKQWIRELLDGKLDGFGARLLRAFRESARRIEALGEGEE